MKSNKRGFSLVELIIVIAILGILSSLIGIGIPAYQRFSDAKQLEMGTRTILQMLLRARSHAVMDGYDRRIYIYPDTGRFLVKKHKYPGDPPGESFYLSQGIKIQENTYIGSNLLELKSIGTVSKGGHITFRSPRGRYRTIVVQIGTGRIYMKEGMIDD
ncbi:MAG TPA: type II secretion system protein [Eubacteriaceae bacterium]|nr:type II secretion system protein [Eubacteriaceae bacterium]